MSKQNSKVLKIYQQCGTVLKLKRNFFQGISFPNLPSIQISNELSDIKEFSTVHYIQIAVANFFKQVKENYSKYKNEMSEKKIIESQIQSSITKIRNTKDLSSRHQQLQHEMEQMKKSWQKQDPLIYYEINQRTKFKNLMRDKFKQYTQSESGVKTMKNPHFFHTLINELKQNLERIFQEDKQYDEEAQFITQQIIRNLKDFAKEMEQNIDTIRYRSFVFQQKKKLFSQFFQVSESQVRNVKGSRNTNMMRHYFQELILVSKSIKDHFKKLILFVDALIVYFKNISIVLKDESQKMQKKYQYFLDQVFKNKEIRLILRFDVQQRVNINLKEILSISQLIKRLPNLFQNYKMNLIECYNEANNYHERYLSRQIKFKQTIQSFEKMLIEHKGYFSSLQKRQEKFNQMNIQNLKKFVRDLYQTIKIVYTENIKQSRLKSELPLHETINKIFAQYDFQKEKSQLSISRTSANEKDLNLKSKNDQFQKFIESIQIFDWNSINWSSYFACSLGPKLLLHGYLQILQQGIYFQSSFNKKNLFFGKTRLFIPKSDIYEVNKQIVLLVFPDVVEIKTNKGEVYFHALGKRDKMYDQLIGVYFPQVPATENDINRQIQFEFQQFKGQNVMDKTAFKLKPYALDFGTSVLKNCDLRVIFRRYFSDDSFTYQGKQYQNFKCYQLQHVGGGLNPASNEITPPPPYYFMKIGQPIFSQNVPDSSIRLSTFQKKIPVIPFISKGGIALCEQKSTYYWASPEFFVIQIQNTMKGFKLTESMIIRIRLFFRQDKQKNEVVSSTSAQIEFKTQGALTGTVRNQALAQTKVVIQKTIQVIQKNEKNRYIYKNKGNSLQQSNDQKQEQSDEIQKLKQENKKLRKNLQLTIVAFIVIYLLTLLIIKFLGSSENQNQYNIKKAYVEPARQQYNGIWSFLDSFYE